MAAQETSNLQESDRNRHRAQPENLVMVRGKIRPLMVPFPFCEIGVIGCSPACQVGGAES